MRTGILFLNSLLIVISVSAKTGTKNKSISGQSSIISGNISNQHITSFAEDAFGHIWIATIRGLNKFNVHEYHQYFNNYDSLSISDNRVNHIYKDSKNQLWVATVNGVSKYNRQDCFDRVPIESPSNNAIYFFENNDGKLFLNMIFAIHVYNPESGSFEAVIEDIDKKDYSTRCFIDKSNNLWIVQSHEIRCYNSNTYELKEIYSNSRKITFSHLDENDVLWLSSFTHLDLFNTKTGQYIPVPEVFTNHPIMVNSMIVLMYPYNNSTTIVQTQKDGIFLYNHTGNRLIHQSENGFPFEVPDFEITTFFTDSQKNLWIGSFDHGYTVQYSYKRRYNNNNFLFSKLEDQSVVSVTTDKENNIWMISQSKGIIVYNSETQHFNTVSHEKLFSFLNSGFQHKAKRLLVDNDNNIWILSEWMLLRTRYENKHLVVKRWYHFPEGIMSIAQDHSGTVWLGGLLNEKIFNMRKGETEFKSFHLYGREFNFTPVMITLSTGQILVASFDQELKLIDPDTWEVSVISIKRLIKLSKFVPTDLYEDSKGSIWIGTLTNGLFHYSPEEGKMRNYKNITCNDISSITEDISGNIWVGTLYGLSKFDPVAQKFYNYYKTDGIGGNQFNEQSVCQMPDNSLIFGGTHGITYFYPIDVRYKRSVPLFFENLKINNELQHPFASDNIDEHLTYNPDIILDYNQRNFTISYTAIDYSEYERVKYAYKLEGFDNFWIEADKSHEAYYSNIPAGKYNFRVKVYNDENTINETERSILVRIRPAPWFSWYAILFYTLVLFFVVFYVVRILKRIKTNREKALQAEREKEQEHMINKMNMSFFSNLSHEFRTPLTMISGPLVILANREPMSDESRKFLYIIQRNVNRMLRLVNQLMDFNKLENDTLKLRVKLTDIIPEISQIIEVFGLNAKEKGIELNTYGLEDNCIMWLDSDKLDKIMTNLIVNALKFSKTDGKIGVSFDVINREVANEKFRFGMNDRGNQFVKISVTDTGIGIPEDKLEKVFERYYQLDKQTREFINWGTGIGLYYARCLVELHHGKIKAANRPEGGAEFSFILPIDDTVYTEEERITEKEQKQYTDPRQQDEIDLVSLNSGDELKPKLLIIDDDTDIIHYLRSLLSPYYDVLYKFDAESAYESLKQTEPELILCDIVMPGTDGYTFSRNLKESTSYCHIPIIFITSRSTVENQVEGLNTGADAYITKPFDPAYLLALINSQLKNRKRIQSLLSSTTKTEKFESDVLSPHDNKFMTDLYELMENELSNPELNINRITEALKMSRTKFYYKVKGLTGENPNVFFKTYKLNRAVELMLEGGHNISEVADITGFSTLSHFSVSFKKQFGVSPSAYHKLA